MGRHILLGIGITLIIFSLGLMVFKLPIPPQEQPKEAVQINKEEVIKRAEKLGMNFPAANYSQGINLESGINLEKTIEKLSAEEEKKQSKTKNKKAADSTSDTDKKDTAEAGKKDKVKLTITKGMKGWEVADLLVDKGLLKERNEFIKLLEKFNIESKIMAGDYEFDAEVSKLEVLLTVTAD